jgi:Bax protein
MMEYIKTECTMKKKHPAITPLFLLALSFNACHAAVLPLPQDTPAMITQCKKTYPLTAQRKRFLNRIKTLIDKKNHTLTQKKQLVINLFQQHKGSFAWRANQDPLIIPLCTQYKVNCKKLSNDKIHHQLLLKVNTIPTPLVLAQAILESNWGSSRFYQQGHNLFGMHCYRKGCGILPRGKTTTYFEVTRYDNDTQSINAYFKTINTNPLYQEFRQSRKQITATNQLIQAHKLVRTLHPYSELKGQYTNILKNLMRCNRMNLDY